MTQEDKELLLQDLCARLPYRVKCSFGVDDAVYEITGVNPTCCGASEIQATHVKSSVNGDFRLNSCKPYLFPLSSMTEEQKQELFELCRFCIEEDWEGKKREVYAIAISSRADPAYCFDHNFYMWGVDIRAIDWLNKNHFDYRGLIEKGLAIDCTNLNIY